MPVVSQSMSKPIVPVGAKTEDCELRTPNVVPRSHALSHACHSAAVAWLEAGVHIKAVADLLGHSSIAITGDIYGHTSDATTRAAIDGLSDALGL